MILINSNGINPEFTEIFEVFEFLVDYFLIYETKKSMIAKNDKELEVKELLFSNGWVVGFMSFTDIFLNSCKNVTDFEYFSDGSA